MRIVINVPIVNAEHYRELRQWLRSVPDGYAISVEFGEGIVGDYELDNPDGPPEEDKRGTSRRNH